MSSKEPQVLEAVTAMARIATLAFHPEGSKIAFRNHNIVICPHSNVSTYVPIKILQGIDRYWNSDSRDDLHMFSHVIKNFIDFYVTPYRAKCDDVTYTNLINLAKYTCVGLIKLQRTYEDQHCNAVLVVQLYVNILKNLIRDKHEASSFYIPIGQPTRQIVGDVDNSDLTLSTIFDIDKFKAFWSRKELNKLCEQFNGCFKNQGEVDDVIFSNNNKKTDAMLNLLLNTSAPVKTANNSKSIDTKSIDMSRASNESGSDYATGSLIDSMITPIPNMNVNPLIPLTPITTDLLLPEPSNQSMPIVKGLVVSIIEILNAMDNRFSLVLTQSLQGVK
jgi:hypothetical protein